MKRIKKALALLLVMAFIFTLSGCKLFSVQEDLLSPPRPQGELFEIEKALRSLSAGKITLKYPTAGEYRSAIIQYDITANGIQDAVAFYSTESENISLMHVAVITKRDGEWVAVRDASVLASGVERVEFEDLDGDGKSEIIVGWSVYGTVDKEIGIYGFDGVTLSPYAHEKYTQFLRTDLNTDQRKELFLIYNNTAEKTATARLLTLENKAVAEITSARSDGAVSDYLQVAQSKLLNGKPAVFVDAQKGTSAITEVFYLEDGHLVNPFYDRESNTTKITERKNNVPSKDINDDGSYDVPMLQLMPGFENAAESDRVYVTKWCGFDGARLAVTLSAVMNYTDGYYFTYPKEYEGKISVDRILSSRTRIVNFVSDIEKGEKQELFRIKTISLNSWETTENEGWEKLLEDKTTVYAVRISDFGKQNGITHEVIQNEFKIIG